MPLTQIQSGMLDSVAQYYSFKNKIINGAMGIWQRGTSSSTLGAYVADRWGVTAGTSVTASLSTDVPAGFQYSLSLAGTNFPQTYQRIESVNCVDLPGQTITVSFWAKQTSGAAANSLAVSLATPNATDNYSAVTTIVTAVTFTGSTSWTQYSATFTNLNSSVVNGLQVLIYANTSGAATTRITGVQLEKGSTATSFDYRPYGTELQLCQRYLPAFNSSSTGSSFGIGQGVSTTGTVILCTFPVQTRVAPTGVSISNISHISTRATTGGQITYTINSGLGYVSTLAGEFSIGGGNGGGLAAGIVTLAYFNNASGQLLFTGCEL